MLESPSSLESSRDPFTGALWWTESSFDGNPCRNSSFARANGILRRLKESNDRSRELDLSTDGARKKLTWISKEDHRSSSSRNLTGNDRLSIQNGYTHLGRSARFGGADSPRRGIHSPAESPLRRGESVRRIRTPSVDFDTTEAPSSATASRRLGSLNHAPRSASFKEGSAAAASAVAKTDHGVVKEASAVWRGLTGTAVGRDQRIAPKPRIPHPTRDELYSPRFFPSRVTDSPESDRMVVSYLAEETDRIIKERIQKLKLRYHSDAADQALGTIDHERTSAGKVMTRTNGSGRRLPSRHFENTKVERVSLETYDMNSDQVRVGDCELDDESSNSPGSSMPGSPSLPISPLLPKYNGFSTIIGEGHGPPTRKISPTMENYLNNRRGGTNTGPQIIVPPRPSAAPTLSSAASSRSNIAVLRQPAESEPENPSTSRNGNRVGRHESFTASPRAALSPINGNEDVTHSTPWLSLKGKGELRIAGEDPHFRGPSQIKESTDSQEIARDFTESVQQQAENGFPSRLEQWAGFLGNGVEMDHSGESHSSQFTQQSEERTSTSGRKLELGTKIAPVRVHSNGAGGGGHSSQKERSEERRPLGGSARHLAARDPLGQNQKFEPEVGKSLISDKVLSIGSGDKHNASRRSQSCRRDSIIRSLLDSPQENASRNKPSALPSGHDTSSDSKNSSRSSVDMRVRSSSDTLPKPSPMMPQIEKHKFLFPDLSDHKSSPRIISTAAPESRGSTPLSSSRKSSVVGHESAGGNLRSSSRRLSVGGHEGGCGNPLSRARSYSVAAGREFGGSPLVSYSEPLQQGLKSPIVMQIDKAKHQRMGTTSSQTRSSGPHMDSPFRDSQLSAKKNSVVWQLERPKTSHKSSLSLDTQHICKRLFVQTKKDNQNGQPVMTSTSVSQVCREVCSMPPSMTVAKPQPPSSPGSSFQRWFANQFKLAGSSKPRSSSAGKDRDPQEEPKPRKKSPWRTRPAEILQGLTRRKGPSSTRPPAVPLFEPNSLQNVQQGSSFDSDSASQSPMSASDPWHDRMMETESGSTTPHHRKSYVLPSMSTMAPARTTQYLPDQLKKYRSHHH